MKHKRTAVPPSVTDWHVSRAVREAVIPFVVGTTLATFCILAVLNPGWFR